MAVPAASGEKKADKDYRPERASYSWDHPEPGIMHRTLGQAATLSAGTESAIRLRTGHGPPPELSGAEFGLVGPFAGRTD